MWKRFVLVVLLAAAYITATGAKPNSDEAAPRCKDILRLLSSTDSILLDDDTLENIKGGVQRVLDCLPERGSIRFDLPRLKLEETLEIKQPVSLEGLQTFFPCVDDTTPVIDIRSKDVLLAGFSFAGCNRNSTSGLIHVKKSDNVTLRDLIFENNANIIGPSCVSAINSNLQMQNITAKNNEGVHGGAMSFVRRSAVGIVNSSFESNHATEQGGAIYMHNSNLNLSDSRFTGNMAFDDGGAIFALGEKESEVNIRNAEFGGNRVYGEYKNDSNWRAGGAIAFLGPKLDVKIVGATFENNSAINTGGAIEMNDGTRLLIEESAFTENSCFQGGAIFIHSSLPNVTSLELIRCNFTRNYAEGNFEGFEPAGGALYIFSNGTKTMLDTCNFIENEAEVFGGAICVGRSERIDILASKFLRNGAGHFTQLGKTKGDSMHSKNARGGAAHFREVAAASIVNSSFTKNHAQRGGGLLVDSGNLEKATLDISGSTFEGNNATGDLTDSTGGALAMSGRKLRCSIENSSFHKNTADFLGGGVLGNNIGYLSLSFSFFERNICRVDRAQRQSRLSSEGSAAETEDTDIITRGGGVSFIRVPQVNFFEVKFIKNLANRGGGLLLDSGDLEKATLNITRSSFKGNAAIGSLTHSDGGGLALFGEKLNCSIEQTIFKENQAVLRGGAFFGLRISLLKLSGSSFLENVCGVDVSNRNLNNPPEDPDILPTGGGVYVYKVPQVIFFEVRFIKNLANRGGGILLESADLEKATLNITGSFFEGNIAAGNLTLSDGGAMALFGKQLKCSVEQTVFKENQAGVNGGAFSGFGIAAASIVKSSFTKNHAQRGGALSLRNGDLGQIDVEIISSTFVENHAHGHPVISNGGAVAVMGNGTACHLENTLFESNSCEGFGGGVYLQDSTMNATHANFTNNTAHGRELQLPLDLRRESLAQEVGGGGAIFLNSSDAFIVHSIFTNNTSKFGGAIVLSGAFFDTILTCISGIVSDFVFEALAQDVGLPTQPKMSIEKCVFRGNRAWESGGAVALDKEVAVKLVDVDFELNAADAGGGALSSSGAELNFDTGNCIQNHARGNGGAIWIGGPKSAAQLTNLTFTSNNSTLGGAIFVEGDANSTLSGCTFSKNQAQLGGGAVCAQHGDLGSTGETREGGLRIAMNWLKFSGNGAGGVGEGSLVRSVDGEGGAVRLTGQGVIADIDGCSFSRNVAGSGGALYLAELHKAEIRDSIATLNAALRGGGLVVIDTASLIKLAGVKFSENSASWGGGMSATATTPKKIVEMELSDVQFLGNTAAKGGAGLEVKGVELHCRSCVFRQNSAGSPDRGEPGDGGGILASSGAFLTLRDCTLEECFAAGSGGGIYAQDTVLKGVNLVVSGNVAGENGGGMAAHFSSLFAPRGDVALLWKCNLCSIDNNKGRVGGGLHLLTSSGSAQDCKALDILREQTFLNGDSSPKDQQSFFQLLEDCGSTPTSSDLSASRRAVFVDTTFEGNDAEIFGSGVFSNDIPVLRMCCDEVCFDGLDLKNAPQSCLTINKGGNQAESMSVGSSLDSVKILPPQVLGQASDEALPPIEVKVLDAFGKIAPENVTLRVQSTAPGMELYGNPVTSDGVLMSGFFIANGVILRALPGTYNVTFEFIPKETGRGAIVEHIVVVIRECMAGEVSRQKGKQCDICGEDFFSFDPDDVECRLCPLERAKCSGAILVPLEGFWHANTQATEIHTCLAKEACTYTNRTTALQEASKKLTTGGMLHFTDSYPQCEEGYMDVLCGSCQPSHGKAGSQQCVKCQGRTPTIFFLSLVVLALATLSFIFMKSAKSYSREINKQAGRAPPVPSLTQTQHQTERRASDVFKILVNFLQVTGSAAAINADWTKGMLAFLTSLGLMSGAAENNSFFAPECAFLTDAMPRSMKATILFVFLPGVVWGAFSMLYSIFSFKKDSPFEYIKLRSFTALLAVLHASYTSVTGVLVRIFHCVGAEPLDGLFWAADTSVVCYQGSHAVLVGIVGFPLLVLISFGFPAWLLFILTRNTRNLSSQAIARRYGFFYRSYRRDAVAWEVVIVARKALLSTIVVFAPPLGEGLQGDMALFVMFVATMLQLRFQPFEDTELNDMELASLILSSLAFMIGNMANRAAVTKDAKIGMSVVFIGAVALYFLYMLKQLFDVGMSGLERWIRKDQQSTPPSSKVEMVKIAKTIVVNRLKEKTSALVDKFSAAHHLAVGAQ
ncbi:hypothetical protein BSKO_06881 [Bryopsis sp. KO-2023]|nr:hypothetical protein BSKO_06881 [Bryopsis sp. KO-2023]